MTGTRDPHPVIPAKAGIQEVFDNTGFRIKSGMTRGCIRSGDRE
jgi:hypothetical protein